MKKSTPPELRSSPPDSGGDRGGVLKNWKLLLLLSCSLALLLYILWGLPNPLRLSTHPAPASTKLLDRNGKLLYEVYADQRRTPVELKSLPKYVWQATLATEDKDFYSHSGFSIRGITRAFISTFFRQKLQGGSTITQQLVKNALLEPDRTIRRKVREFILSAAVETFYKKDQILEFYLNQVPYGGTAYGIEAAAQTYFGKHASDLTLSEAALLAGLPQAPSFYSPFSRPELAKQRQEYVLKQMLEAKFIDQDQWQTAKDQELKYSPPPSLKAPHFSLWVKDYLVQKYGLSKVEEDGLTVTTTLDFDLQKFAQDAVATEVARLKSARVGNGAVLVTQPKTGQILAMVGSKDYFDIAADGNVNVTLAHRQPGSAIKPINYALAIEHHILTASSVLADKPTCFLIPDQKPYCPVNYDGQWHGPTQVRFALANSFNIPAVKTLVLNGLENFVASSSAFGLTTFTDPTKYGPSITLGGGEVTMLDLATAYGVLANTGQRISLNPILKVVDRSGKVLEETPKLPSNTRVISPGTAYIISHLLLDNGARSAMFGPSSYLNVRNHPEVSVKTGTTNDRRDNWTIGYNPDILVAVWVGNNDNSPMSAVASGVTGASPIWNKIISFALKDTSAHWPVQPPDVIGALVCSLSGLKAPDLPAEALAQAGCGPRYEYFLKGTVPPVQIDSIRRDIAIFRPTQSPATSKQITEQAGEVEMQNHAVVFDPLGVALCLDCAGGYGEADNIRLDRHGQAVKN
ncbi:MAG: transglycosylase domain-containing protein [Patescibacteria group bacterium]